MNTAQAYQEGMRCEDEAGRWFKYSNRLLGIGMPDFDAPNPRYRYVAYGSMQFDPPKGF